MDQFRWILLTTRGVAVCVFNPNRTVQDIQFGMQLRRFDTLCDPNRYYQNSVFMSLCTRQNRNSRGVFPSKFWQHTSCGRQVFLPTTFRQPLFADSDHSTNWCYRPHSTVENTVFKHVVKLFEPHYNESSCVHFRAFSHLKVQTKVCIFVTYDPVLVSHCNYASALKYTIVVNHTWHTYVLSSHT